MAETSMSGDTDSAIAGGQSAGGQQVPAGGPEAGAGGVTGSVNNTAAGQPDQSAGQPKGKPGPNQSNDNLPQWTQQLSKKYVSDLESVTKLQAFKSLDDFVQAYLDGAGQQLSLPGEKSTPEELHAFYEKLGKPKEAASYSFAKDEPAFAQVAFNANLTSAQAEALYKASLAQVDDMRKGMMALQAKDFAATDVLLQKEYGDKSEEAVTLMQRGLGINPKTGELSPIAKSLKDAGLAGKPEIVRAFIELGRAISEGTAAGGNSKAGGAKSIMDGRGFGYQESYS